MTARKFKSLLKMADDLAASLEILSVETLCRLSPSTCGNIINFTLNDGKLLSVIFTGSHLIHVLKDKKIQVSFSNKN